jgi:hypothetical protein
VVKKMTTDLLLSDLVRWHEPQALELAKQLNTPRTRWLLHVAEHGNPHEIAEFKGGG